jgi:hypothetical protein
MLGLFICIKQTCIIFSQIKKGIQIDNFMFPLITSKQSFYRANISDIIINYFIFVFIIRNYYFHSLISFHLSKLKNNIFFINTHKKLFVINNMLDFSNFALHSFFLFLVYSPFIVFIAY